MTLQFAERVARLGAPYAPPRPKRPPQLDLRDVIPDFQAILGDCAGSYPKIDGWRDTLADNLGLPMAMVHPTAGGDDALLQIMLAMMEEGGNLVTAVPTFPMIQRYVAMAGGDMRCVPWIDAAFPEQAIVDSIDANTRIVLVTSPNNPTGQVVPIDVIARIRDHAPQALIVLDAVYMAYSDQDITDAVLAMPNTVVVQSFSKAYGAAGLRLGYALSRHADLLLAMQKVAQPYGISQPSINQGLKLLAAKHRVDTAIAAIKANRTLLQSALTKLGFSVWPSQANFVFFACKNAEQAQRMFESLGDRGISVRCFPNDPHIAHCVRIGVPLNEQDLATLMNAITKVSP